MSLGPRPRPAYACFSVCLVPSAIRTGQAAETLPVLAACSSCSSLCLLISCRHFLYKSASTRHSSPSLKPPDLPSTQLVNQARCGHNVDVGRRRRAAHDALSKSVRFCERFRLRRLGCGAGNGGSQRHKVSGHGRCASARLASASRATSCIAHA